MAAKMQEALLKAAEIALSFVKMSPDTLTEADNREMDKALASTDQLKAKHLPAPKIAVGDLSKQEVQGLFGISPDASGTFKWDKAAFEGFAVYTDKGKSEMEYVEWTLNAYEKTYERAPWNEPLASTPLDTLLLTTTYILGAYEKPGTAGVNLQFESSLTWAGKRKKLQGQADYTLFYDRPSKNASNLLIVEAKRHAEFGRGPAGLLSYMAMVVKARHSAGDGGYAVVFGLLSDGYTFHFYRLSHGMKSMYYQEPTLLYNPGSAIVFCLIIALFKNSWCKVLEAYGHQYVKDSPWWRRMCKMVYGGYISFTNLMSLINVFYRKVIILGGTARK